MKNSMHICYVSNSRFPSERAHMTQIVHMCNAFVENGHTVDLVVTNRSTHITELPEVFFGVEIQFAVKRVAVPDIAGISHTIPPFLRPIAFMLQRTVFAWRVYRLLRKTPYDLVYGRDEWVLWLLSWVSRYPLIWESHEAKFSFAVRRLIRSVKKLVVISEGIRDYYLQEGVPAPKIGVAHDAVDARFFLPHISQAEARTLLGIETEKPVVMYIGGLEKWKGVQTLIDASRDQDSFETYVIGGKPEELGYFRVRNPHIHFLGPRPYRELPKLQQAADILVIPNTATIPLSAEYTSPLKLFTYMTSTKPIVASYIPSIAHVLTEKESFFFEPDDPLSLQKKIIDVINNPRESTVRALNAFALSKKYTWKERAQAILSSL